MSNYLIFSDLHLGLKKDDPMFHKISLDLADWIKSTSESRGIKDIIFLGDFFHNRKNITLSTLDVASKFLSKLKNFHIYMITGNHDCLYLDNSSVHSISMFKRHSNITVIDTPMYFDILAKRGSIRLGFIPWGIQPEDIESCDYLFGHFEIVGFQMGHAFCKHGISAESLLEKSNNVFSGHFHKPQKVETVNGSITYVGSPFQHNWGEAGQSKYIYELNIDSGELEFIENKISPKHLLVDIEKFKVSESKNNIIRVRYSDSDENKKKLESIKMSNPLCLDSILVEESSILTKSINDYKSVSILDSFKNAINSLDCSNEFKDKLQLKCKELYNHHS